MRLLVWMTLGLVACSGTTQDDGPINQSDLDMDGVSSAEGDCNDQDPEIYPGADDIVGDGIDRNCDQSDGVDADGDRDPSLASGGDDCDDEDPTVNSMAEEVGWDGIDQNCDQKDQFDFEDICAGDRFTCGVNSQGDVLCWGLDTDGIVSDRPQTGEYVQLDCGRDFVCARDDADAVTCWGNDDEGVVSDTPSETALAVYAGLDHACIIRQSDSRPQCWGKAEAFEGLSGANFAIRDMALGNQYTCVTSLNSGGFVDCWGVDNVLPVSAENPLPGDINMEWIKISGGFNYVCGIEADQSLWCFSQTNLAQNGEKNPLEDLGPYSFLDVYNDWACAIKEAREISCWGSTINPVASNPFVNGQPDANTSLSRVGVGRRHACALRTEDREVICWGQGNDGETVVPNFAILSSE